MKIEVSHVNVMLGAAVLGEIMNGNITNVPYLLEVRGDNEMQESVKLSMFYMENNRLPDIDSIQDVELMDEIFSIAQNNLRILIQNLFNRVYDCESSSYKEAMEYRKKLELEQLVRSQKESHKPHEMGTVAEIATKYGISKSEVRRLKAEGLLHTLN